MTKANPLNDLDDPFEHGQEGTHSICKNRMASQKLEKITCCACTPHDNCNL